jgi:hypothetical protein
MAVDVKFRALETEQLHAMFPWGPILFNITQHPEFRYDNDAVMGALISLRQYTKANLYAATDEHKIKEFTADGIHKCIPHDIAHFDAHASLKNGLFLLALYLAAKDHLAIAKILQGIIYASSYVVNKTAKARFNKTVGQCFKTWRYRSTVSSLVRQHEKELARYLLSRK